MALEVMEQILKAEEKSREAKAAAEAEARRLKAEAEREGAEMLKRALEEASTLNRQAKLDAEKRANETAKAIRDESEARCAALRQSAADAMDAAAEFIKGKVVSA